MRDFNEPEENPTLSGTLLIAHPGLLDPNFRRTVVLISAHSGKDGALGVVLNRPMGKTLGDQKAEFTSGPLANVPLYYGGPVNSDEMILAAWNWENDKVFRLYFGISREKASEMMQSDPGTDLRAFIGYAGWSGGQLESELKQNAWVVCPVEANALAREGGEPLWRHILSRVKPELAFLANTPEDPSRN